MRRKKQKEENIKKKKNGSFSFQRRHPAFLYSNTQCVNGNNNNNKRNMGDVMNRHKWLKKKMALLLLTSLSDVSVEDNHSGFRRNR